MDEKWENKIIFLENWRTVAVLTSNVKELPEKGAFVICQTKENIEA